MSTPDNPQQKLTALLYRYIGKPNMLAHMLLTHGCLSDGFMDRLYNDDGFLDGPVSMGDISTFKELEKFMSQHVFKPHKKVVTAYGADVLSNMLAHLQRCIEQEDYEGAKKMTGYIETVRDKIGASKSSESRQ